MMYMLPPGPKAPLPTVLSPQEAAAEARERLGGMTQSKVLEEVSPLAGNITSQTCTHTCIDNHNLITCGRHGYTAKNHTI